MTPQHCEHECVCRWYVDEEYCMHPDIPDCIPLPCPYDTRTSRPATHEPHGVCPDSVKICPEVDCDKCRQAIARATAAENTRVLETLDKFYDNIKVAHRYDTSNYGEGLLDGIDLSITEIRGFPESLRTGGERE